MHTTQTAGRARPSKTRTARIREAIVIVWFLLFYNIIGFKLVNDAILQIEKYHLQPYVSGSGRLQSNRLNSGMNLGNDSVKWRVVSGNF